MIFQVARLNERYEFENIVDILEVTEVVSKSDELYPRDAEDIVFILESTLIVGERK